MRITIEVTTPAQLHLYKNIIKKLKEHGHAVALFVHPKESTLKLADDLKIEHTVIGADKLSWGGKIIATIYNCLELRKKIKAFRADLCIGEIATIFAAWSLRKLSIIFEDDEVTWVQHFLYKPFVSKIITPFCFRKDFGKKHIRMNGYKELAYLLPAYFKPDKQVLKEVGLKENEKFIILRWNTWDAIHDIGKHGFDKEFILNAIKDMEKYARVLISTERELPQELKKYAIRIPFSKIHSLLCNASLLISDTQTLSTEAAVLGIPTVRANSFVGPGDMSNFIELEKNYGLIFNFTEPKEAVRKALELIQSPNLKQEWTKKRERLLKDKIDVATFMTWLIEDYPESIRLMKENPDYQERFK